VHYLSKILYLTSLLFSIVCTKTASGRFRSLPQPVRPYLLMKARRSPARRIANTTAIMCSARQRRTPWHLPPLSHQQQPPTQHRSLCKTSASASASARTQHQPYPLPRQHSLIKPRQIVHRPADQVTGSPSQVQTPEVRTVPHRSDPQRPLATPLRGGDAAAVQRLVSTCMRWARARLVALRAGIALQASERELWVLGWGTSWRCFEQLEWTSIGT
jgi:hypothetical protein